MTVARNVRPVGVKSSRKATVVDLQIGKRLRKWRLAQDVEACELAQKLGVTQQQLQKYEKGQTRIAASRLYEIAQTLSIPVHWFFLEPTPGDDDAPLFAGAAGISQTGEQAQDCSGQKLLRHYLKIEDRHVRRAILELAAILVPTQNDASKTDCAKRNG